MPVQARLLVIFWKQKNKKKTPQKTLEIILADHQNFTSNLITELLT